MAKKKVQSQPPAGSKIYNIHAKVAAFDHGKVEIGQMYESGGDMSVSGGMDVKALAEAFERITRAINAMPEGPDKTIAQGAAQGLKQESEKGEQADEGKVRNWFNALARWAPDAFDVVIDTFVNPIKGLHTAFKKIAEEARAEKAKQKK